MSATSPNLPIGILYEHPEWFAPLFAELDRRHLHYERILAHEHRFDPAERSVPYSLVVNRVSPSSYLRGHGRAIGYTRHYLSTWSGSASRWSTVRARTRSSCRRPTSWACWRSWACPYPASRVVNAPDAIAPAAAEAGIPTHRQAEYRRQRGADAALLCPRRVAGG